MFDQSFIRYLAKNGHTVSDAVRALREDGPLDRIGVRLRCTGCGREQSKSMRWFHLQEMRCECGSVFDTEPFDRYILWAQTTSRILPDGFFTIPKEEKGND
jgi:hypothetical protein